MRIGVLLMTACFTATLCSCSSPNTFQIVTEPEGAFIKVNGKNVGVAPQEHKHESGRALLVTVSKEGFFDENVQLTKNSPQIESGLVRVVLQENPVWRETTTSRATNVWLRIQINEALTQDAVWQRVVDSVTSTYDSLEQLDPKSGYLRSTAREKSWNIGNGVFRVRTQLIGSIATLSPLIYKFKIKSEYSKGRQNDWQEYDRVFREDAGMIEELSNRLGIK